MTGDKKFKKEKKREKKKSLKGSPQKTLNNR